MTSRMGQRNRKKVPKPRLEESHGFKMPSIVCPFCNNHFDLGKLEGSIGSRVCPFCKEEITFAYYNNVAKTVIQEKKVTEEELRSLRQQLDVVNRKLDASKAWWKFPKRLVLKIWYRHLLKKLTPKMNSLKNRLKSRKQKLRVLARNSYYLSEWFLHTHFLINDDEKRFLNVKFDEEANLDVWVVNKNMKSAGFRGEISVFNIFLNESLRSGSPLSGCRLLPNIFVPATDKRRDDSVFWAQIDLVILTRSCAFVVEVKSWNSDVLVDMETGDIFSTKETNSLGESLVVKEKTYFKSRCSLAQNSNHASWFYENFKCYPFYRIFEMTLFVNPTSFESEFVGFENNVFAGVIEEGNYEAMEVMAETVSSLSDMFSQDKVDKMADELLNRYGDLNQKRGRIHKNKVSKLAKSFN